MKLLRVLTCAGLLGMAAFPGHSADFTDSFETGDTTATNAKGFKWGSLNYTSIVTADEVVWNGSKISIAVPPGRDWVPYDGEHSMRFRYGAGKNMSEQRFDLGAAYPEIWVRFWLRVPTNFKHGSDSSNNNKLFAIWMDGYEGRGLGSTVVWQYRNNGQGGSVSPVYYWSTVENMDLRTVHNGEKQSKPFISYPADQGRWMSLVFHLKAATSKTTNNGVIEMWRRWADETEYTKFHEIKDADISAPVNGPIGWKAGYLMGWANSPYSTTTEFLLDEFTVSATSLLESDVASDSDPLQDSTSRDPVSTRVEPPTNLSVTKKKTVN